jgi:quercetin dioxygenase-like cupin family protein
MAADRQAAFLPPGEGKSYWSPVDYITFKLTGEQTGGEFELCEVLTPPQVGPPPHIHHREDETFYVLEGEVEFMVGDRTLRATPGSVVYGARGVPHAFRNVGAKTSRMMMLVTPPNFASFVRAAGQPATDPTSPPPMGPPEIEKLLAACREHGIEVLGPPPSG